MLKLHMSPVFAGAQVTLGPAPSFRLRGNLMFEGDGGDPVGELRNHQWRIQGRHFMVIHADPGSKVRFENASGSACEEAGPFEELYLVDGSIFGEKKLVAQFDEHNGNWRSAATLDAWAVVVVGPGEGARWRRGSPPRLT